MPSTLYFDTETTGKWNFKAPATDPNQPSLVQVAAILEDSGGTVRGELSIIVQPNGWTVSKEVAEFHGITHDIATSMGVSLANACYLFRDLFVSADVVVAHNIDFDKRIVNRALAQADVPELPWERLTSRCTMLASKPLLKLPGKFGDFKWPSLAESHAFFMGTGFDGAHDALADTRACRKVYHALVERGVFA